MGGVIQLEIRVILGFTSNAGFGYNYLTEPVK